MRLISSLVFALLLALTPSSKASILASRQLKNDFTEASDANNKACWSEPDNLAVSSAGLGRNGEANSMRDGWIQTAPLAVGLSWRVPYAVSIRVAIHPLPTEYVLRNGQKITPDGGDVYVRYSPDLKHWSTWQVLQRAKPQSLDEKRDPGRLFSGGIRVPYVERNDYVTLLQEYSNLDVPWKSDEEAAVNWLLQSRPDFFSKHLSFIGYVQFLYEGGFYGGQRIKSFKADLSYAMSGIHAAPKNKDIYGGRDSSPWRFNANEAVGAEQKDAPDKE